MALEEIDTASVTLVEGPIVNEDVRLVMAVTRHEDRLRWTRVNHPVDVVYNLAMGYWDQERELLYVHSYPEDGLVLSIAKMLCGPDVELLLGEAVFRVLHGFRRVMLTNLGVKETQVKPIRFQLSTGIDITEQLEATVENRVADQDQSVWQRLCRRARLRRGRRRRRSGWEAQHRVLDEGKDLVAGGDGFAGRLDQVVRHDRPQDRG